MTLKIDSHHHLWDLREPFDYRWLDGPAMSPIQQSVSVREPM